MKVFLFIPALTQSLINNRKKVSMLCLNLTFNFIVYVLNFKFYSFVNLYYLHIRYACHTQYFRTLT